VDGGAPCGVPDVLLCSSLWLEREKYRDSIYYQSCVDFCERWDQSSFDPDYKTESLDYFIPMVMEVFSRKAHDPAVQQKGVVRGLPMLATAAE